MKQGPASHKAQGFTLLELLITLSVAAILLGIAAPGFQSTIQETRQKSLVSELVGALVYARSEAIKRSSRISVCARSNNTSCGTNWNTGWIVYIDNEATPGVIDGTESVLKVTSIQPKELKVSNSAIVKGSSDAIQRPYIRFGPRGLSNWRGSGSFTFCDDRGTAAARAINVSMSGDVRQARADGTGGVHDTFGDAISCAAGAA